MALVGGAALLAAWRTRSCLGEETRFPSDGEEGSLTFMILSRSSKKRWGLSGFVKKSARGSRRCGQRERRRLGECEWGACAV